jgi:hypothetical protein
MKTLDNITDDELEVCVEGSTNLTMLRDLLEQCLMDGLVHEDDFADVFAMELEKHLDTNLPGPEYIEAYDVNWEWGMRIAENVNDLLRDEWDE